MLILSRKHGERIMIGDDIIIENMSFQTVKIGIKTLKDIPVHREEIYLKIKENENQITS